MHKYPYFNVLVYEQRRLGVGDLNSKITLKPFYLKAGIVPHNCIRKIIAIRFIDCHCKKINPKFTHLCHNLAKIDYNLLLIFGIDVVNRNHIWFTK